MSTPDVTAAQIVGALGALITALVVLFKLDLSDAQQAGLITALGTIVPVAWAIADAIIRHGRSKVAAALVTAAAEVNTGTTVTSSSGYVPPPIQP